MKLHNFLGTFVLVLSFAVGASAQEGSEVSGGGGGGITAAPGSGTTGRVPQFASSSSLADSKMLTSGTNSGTWTLYDDTAVTGVTSLVVRAGIAGDSWPTKLIDVHNNADTSIGGFVANGSTLSTWSDDFRDPGSAYFALNGSAYDSLSMRSSFDLLWSSGAMSAGSGDVGLSRSAAGILKVTDGSTGQGGIGIADAATNTVSDALILRHQGGTVAASFGTGLLFQGEDAAGNMQDMASIDAVYDVATDTAEQTHLKFYTHYAGAEYHTATMYLVDPQSLAGSISFPNGAGGGLVTQSGPMRFLSFTDIAFGQAGVAYRWRIPVSTGHWVPETTNTYDIGTSSAFVRNAYVSTSIQGTRTKTLTDNTITDVVQISSATTDRVTAGRVSYTVYASDATNHLVQTETGEVPFLLVNENGTVTVTLGTTYGTAIDSAGGAALSNTFASSVSGTNAKIRVTSDYDQATLTGTVTHTIEYRVYIDSGTATVTPQ